MLKSWLNHTNWPQKLHFNLIEVTENKIADEGVKYFLNTQMLEEYAWINFLIDKYRLQDKSKLVNYLEKQKLPDNIDNLSKNVWQGDLWEIIAKLIVLYYRDLAVPANKLRVKENKDKSVFWIDMIAHNKWDKISDWIYYEVKTKQDLAKKDYNDEWNPRYITLVAYDWLKSIENNNESAAAHLMQTCYYSWDYKQSALYWEIVDGTNKVKKYYEIFIIWEKSTYKEDIIDALDNINPSLSPLSITIVLIDWFKKLVEDLRNKICDDAVKIVYP